MPLPFYLLRPKVGGRTRSPLVLTPHGHGHPHIYVGLFDSPEEEAQIHEGERDIAVQAVEQGYLVSRADHARLRRDAIPGGQGTEQDVVVPPAAHARPAGRADAYR